MHRVIINFMRMVIHKWYSSFDLFEPKELNVLSLVSLNTVVKSSGVLIKYFSWWFFVWAGYIDLYIDGFGLFSRFPQYITPLYLAIGFEPRLHLLTIMVGVFLIVLSVRSSLQPKTLSYFLHSITYLAPFAVLFFILPHIYTVPVFWLSCFFLCDGRLDMRGVLMSVYNGAVLNLMYAPVLLCVGAVHGILFNVHRLLWDFTPFEEYHFAPYAAKYTISILLYLFFVASLHAFYVRVVQVNSSNSLFWRRYIGARNAS